MILISLKAAVLKSIRTKGNEVNEEFKEEIIYGTEIEHSQLLFNRVMRIILRGFCRKIIEQNLWCRRYNFKLYNTKSNLFLLSIR